MGTNKKTKSEEIYEKYHSGYSIYELADMYDISSDRIQGIITRWSNRRKREAKDNKQ